ncbi:MAG: hypothetical protein ACOZQL_42170 [Myxococcota bacterium]
MSDMDLQSLWQSQEDEPNRALAPKELLARPQPERTTAPLSAESVTWLTAALTAHRRRSLWRLRPGEFFAAARALRALSEPRAGNPKQPLAFAFAALALLALLGAVAVQLNRPATPAPQPAIARAPAPFEPTLEELLAECRTFATGPSPDWGRAEAACHRAVELEPLDRGAREELSRVERLHRCQSHLDMATALLEHGQDERALDALAAIDRDCEDVFLRARQVARAPLDAVKKATSRQCETYAKAGQWAQAARRCEVAARLACQAMTPADWEVPQWMKLKLEGPLNPRTDWRPSDPTLLAFFRAREHQTPGVGPWECPRIAAFESPPPEPDTAALAMRELAQRSSEPELGRALGQYFQGHFVEAPVTLQKVLETMSKAAAHDEARALLGDLQHAISLFEAGQSHLLRGEVERAADRFRQALELDERLMLGARADELNPEERRRALAVRTSYLRRSANEALASAAYEKGRGLADRKDFRAACLAWKLGLEFDRGHLDLLRAATVVCTTRARELSDADSCAALRQVLDFAVDGDGYREQALEALARRGCP